jgi:hypothetical protein
MSYPNVVNFTYYEKNQQYEFQKKIMELREEASEDDIEDGDREVFIDFRNDFMGKFITKVRNLKEKDPKIKERVKPWDKDHLNFIVIFVDTVSRNNFHRKYRHTKAFLQKYNYRLKKNLRLYEYFRMHSIRGYTFPNLFASTYGMPYEVSWSKDHLKRIESYAKENGYITGMSSDCCTYTESEVKCKPFFNSRGRRALQLQRLARRGPHVLPNRVRLQLDAEREPLQFRDDQRALHCFAELFHGEGLGGDEFGVYDQVL